MSESASRDRLSHDEAAEVGREMATLVNSALPLPAGLRALAGELPAGRARRVLFDLAERIERGESLDTALQAIGARLPGSLGGLILVGLRTGRLPLVLEQYVDGARRARDLSRQIWSAVAYPLLLLLSVAGVLMVLFPFVVPPLDALYADFEIALPLLTEWLLAAAPVFERLLQALLLAAALATAFLATIGRTQFGRRLKRRLPLFGCLVCWSALARWYRLLALMTQQQIPAAAAARMLAQSVDDPVLSQASDWLAGRIESGAPLSEPMAERADLWGRAAPLIRWAEERALVPESLEALAVMFEQRCVHHAAFLRSAMPTALFVLVVFLLGCTVVALVLPVFQLITVLGRN